MIRAVIFAVLLALTFGLAACSGSDQGDPVLRKSLEKAFGGYGERPSGFGKVVEITTLNGQQAEVFGVKLHEFYYRLVITLHAGSRWVYGYYPDPDFKLEDDVANPSQDQIAAWADRDSRPLPEGTTYVETGEIRMRLSDAGWEVDFRTRLRCGACPKDGPSQCVKILKLEDPSWTSRLRP